MNVVNLGVLAGHDPNAGVTVVLILLGTATLMLLATARISARAGVARAAAMLTLEPATLPAAQPQGDVAPYRLVLRRRQATRAPPDFPPRQCDLALASIVARS